MESSKFKLNKTKFIQMSLLLLALFLIFFTYFFNLKKKQPSTNLDQTKTIESDGREENVANTFSNVEYSGLDQNGNRFVIGSKYADFATDRPNVIRMKQILCTFYFKDGTRLAIQSSTGIYNSVTGDMEFTGGNVKMNYLENILFAEKASFFNMKNEL